MGKVKEHYTQALQVNGIEYQFPMGKVKKIKKNYRRLNSLVSIPYGKGKEQHLVLCFYYNT